MQVKIVIGTVAFMLTMIILGYAALREPARLHEFTLAAEGRRVENGAFLYEGNCASCHGVEGKAEKCFDSGSGDEIDCIGRPLNSYFLVCGNPSQRVEESNFEGTTQQFVLGTIAAGRVGTQMPSWLSNYGGPLREDQVGDLTAYIMNFSDEAFCAEAPVTFPWPEAADLDTLATMDITDPVEFTAVAGDPERGAELYTSYTCNVCHGQLDTESSAIIGPWLGDIVETGGDQVDGLTAKQYVYQSILDVNAFIAPDCPNGACTDPSAMRSDFPSAMATSPQDMIDLLSYIVGE